ncbi:MAG: glycosyltransferase [Planctomycetaceae bacterium]
MQPLSIVIAGMVAGQPGQGGAAWAVLQYVLGLRSLGHRVTLVEPVTVVAPGTERFFADVVREFDLAGAAALVPAAEQRVVGLARESLEDRCRHADLLLNISGMLRAPALVEPIPRRVFLDLDPAFNQIWHLQGADMGLDHHTHWVTIAANMGRPGCTVPTCDHDWITTLQPICLDRWPAVEGPVVHDGLTTVGHWRSYGSVTHEGVFHGQKAHAWREVIDIPQRLRRPCLPAVAIHPHEVHDLAALRAHGWQLLDPAVECGTPADYQRFVQGSWAELGIAKSGYVVSNSGWFSDRSVCYLASGRPVIASDTGFATVLPTGAGLFSFATSADVPAAEEAIASDYARHRRAARDLAEGCFDARRVLPRLLEHVMG